MDGLPQALQEWGHCSGNSTENKSWWYFLPQDMSAYVKKVNFKLHDSYSNAARTVTKPPYELTETGWGEFEIVIKIYFQVGNTNQC